MSARADGERVAALVEVIEELVAGRNQQLDQVLEKVFGWSPERVFLAVDAAVRAGRIARNGDSGAVSAPGRPS